MRCKVLCFVASRSRTRAVEARINLQWLVSSLSKRTTEIGNVVGRSDLESRTVLLLTTALKLGLVEAVDGVLVQDDETFRRNMCLVKTFSSLCVRWLSFLGYCSTVRYSRRKASGNWTQMFTLHWLILSATFSTSSITPWINPTVDTFLARTANHKPRLWCNAS